MHFILVFEFFDNTSFLLLSSSHLQNLMMWLTKCKHDTLKDDVASRIIKNNI